MTSICLSVCSGPAASQDRSMPVELHGYLAYIGNCAVSENPYTTYGYKGKQVRDQLHSSDVAQPMLEIYRRHRRGEVYNVGGDGPTPRRFSRPSRCYGAWRILRVL